MQDDDDDKEEDAYLRMHGFEAVDPFAFDLSSLKEYIATLDEPPFRGLSVLDSCIAEMHRDSDDW